MICSQSKKPILIERLLELTKLDDNLFCSQELFMALGARSVYGGIVVAQALIAAFKTLQDPHLLCHSCHSYFLLPGRIDEPIKYQTEIIRDGRTVSTRRVIAYQGTDPKQKMFIFEGSFKKPESFSYEYQKSCPAVPPPEKLLSIKEIYRKIYNENSGHPSCDFVTKLELKSEEIVPIEERPCETLNLENLLTEKTKSVPISFTWIRPYGEFHCERPAQFHQAVAAFASDHVLFCSLLPFGLIPGSPNLSFITSMDHCIYFHSPFLMNKWTLFETECSRMNENRAFVQGRMYTSEGTLFLSCVQEGLVRLNLSPSSSFPFSKDLKPVHAKL